MHKEIIHKDERNPASIPFKPFSVLTVTNRRIIGKRYIPIAPMRFEREISISKIIDVSCLPKTSFLTVPSLTIKYKKGREISQVTIHFPGFISELAGYDPEEVYKIIISHMQ